MQTILGAGGAVGSATAKALRKYTDQLRLVSRNPTSSNPNDQLVTADLTNAEAVIKAVEGSDVVYLTAGLNYDLKTWQKLWPVIMKNVIESCEKSGAKLVFFDNVYMYGVDQIPHMTENSIINPPSKKGKVRAEIANMLLQAVKDGRIEALIARCADYYGPGIKGTSMLTETVFKNFSEGKKANWLGGLDFKHSFTYVPDAGAATAMLGNTPDAFNQIWHLPTASNPMTGKEIIEHIAKLMNVEPKIQAAPKFIVRILGLFMPIMKEMVEMIYQNERDYVFDSSKFEKRFDFKPTPYSEGLKAIVDADYS